MEVKIIDHNHKCIALIDTFTSLIWTERYDSPGDFEIECPAIADAVSWVENGCLAEINESSYSMIIEEVNLRSDFENGLTMTVRGRSLECLLERRCFDQHVVGGGRLPVVLNGFFRRTLINVLGNNKELLSIPEFNYVPPSDIDIPGIESYQIEGDFSNQSLLEAITNCLAGSGLGFSLKRYASVVSSKWSQGNSYVQGDIVLDWVDGKYYRCNVTHTDSQTHPGAYPGVWSQLSASEVTALTAVRYNFEIIAGADRTLDQNNRPKVIFASEFDNMINSDYTKSTSTYKNAALVSGDGDLSDHRWILYIPGIDWHEGAEYAVDDIVRYEDDELFYICNTAHTSNDNNAPGNATYWRVSSDTSIIPEAVKGKNLRVLFVDASDISMIEEIEYPEWVSGTNYNVGDIVLDPADEKYYKRISGIVQPEMHPSSSATGWAHVEPELEREIPSHRYNKYLAQRGLESLMEINADNETYSGEAEPRGTFEYGRDFFIGDIVTIVNDFGMPINARVTEVIRSEDQNGVTVVPTFSA